MSTEISNESAHVVDEVEFAALARYVLDQMHVHPQAELSIIFVDVPAMTLTADPQRYTRLLPDVYRYQSLDSDFTRDVVVDDEGFVLSYPGLFSRVPAAA